MQGIGTDRRRRIRTAIFWTCLLIALVLFDQIIKTVIRNDFTNNGQKDITVIKNFFYITYKFNEGAAWSFLAGVPWAQIFFKVLTVLALIAFYVIFLIIYPKKCTTLKVGLILLIAGTMGNFIDRIAYGGVVDFLGFIFGNYYFPIFNIADSCMTIGVILVIVHLLFLDKSALFIKHDKTSKIQSK